MAVHLNLVIIMKKRGEKNNPIMNPYKIQKSQVVDANFPKRSLQKCTKTPLVSKGQSLQTHTYTHTRTESLYHNSTVFVSNVS